MSNLDKNKELIASIEAGNREGTLTSIRNFKITFEKEKQEILDNVTSFEIKLNQFIKKVENALNDKSFKSLNKLLLDIEKLNEDFDFLDDFNENYSSVINDINFDIFDYAVLLNNERILRVKEFLINLQNKHNTKLDIKLLLDSSKNLEGIEVLYNKKTVIHSYFYYEEVNTTVDYVENEAVDSFVRETVLFLEEELESLTTHEYSNEYLEFSKKEFTVITFENYSILDKLTNKFNRFDAINLRDKTFLVNETVLNFLNQNELGYKKENELNLVKNKYFEKSGKSIIFTGEESRYLLNSNGILTMEGPTSSLQDFIANVPINFI